MDNPSFKCVLGMDLRESSEGAIAFADWLVQTGQSGTTQVLPTCVVQKHMLPRDLLYEPASNLALRVAQIMRDRLRDQGALNHFEEVAAFGAADVATALLQQSKSIRAHAVIVGRRGSGSLTALALGRVTRHLIAHPDVTVIVVPPRLEYGVGTGPVILATDLTPASVPAASFTARVAKQIERPVHAIHIALPEPTGPLPARLDAQRADIAAWAVSAGLDNALAVPKLGGDVVSSILAFAESVSACLVVCGLGRHGRLDQAVAAGTARDLSAHGPVPIAVVPSS